MQLRHPTPVWQTVCFLALGMSAVSCGDDPTGTGRDLGATVTSRLYGMPPQALVVEIRPSGHVLVKTVELATDETIAAQRGELTTEEFDELSRLIGLATDFDPCYCDDGGISDGPTQAITISGETNVEVRIYGVGYNTLPPDLLELVHLLSAVNARVRDAVGQPAFLQDGVWHPVEVYPETPPSRRRSPPAQG